MANCGKPTACRASLDYLQIRHLHEVVMDFPKLSSGKVGTVKVLSLTVEFAVGLGSGFCWTKPPVYPYLSPATQPTLCKSTSVTNSVFADADLHKQIWSTLPSS